MNPFYTDYSDFLSRIFPGTKIQKISVSSGFSCPNRDGTLGTGGCIYCDNRSFTPAYCLQGDSLESQIEKGKAFFSRKYPNMQFLAYFQSYTGTYGDPDQMLSLFRRALACDDVRGLVIGTRPDCVSAGLLSDLAGLDKEKTIIMEYGAETSCNRTLKEINRGHTWRQTVDAVKATAEAGIHCGLHLIAGLPGEDHDRILRSVRDAVSLPIDTIKLHQMQIIRGTELERRWRGNPSYIQPMTADEYLSLCTEIVRIVPRHIAIERFVSQSPADMLIAPKWGLKNYEFTNLLLNRLKQNPLTRK